MQNGDKIKIDESIKVASWATNFATHEQVLRPAFDQYGSQQIVTTNTEAYHDYSDLQEAEQELRGFDHRASRIKKVKMDKLKDLKNEYETIRKITTD